MRRVGDRLRADHNGLPASASREAGGTDTEAGRRSGTGGRLLHGRARPDLGGASPGRRRETFRRLPGAATRADEEEADPTDEVARLQIDQSKCMHGEGGRMRRTGEPRRRACTGRRTACRASAPGRHTAFRVPVACIPRDARYVHRAGKQRRGRHARAAQACCMRFASRSRGRDSERMRQDSRLHAICRLRRWPIATASKDRRQRHAGGAHAGTAGNQQSQSGERQCSRSPNVASSSTSASSRRYSAGTSRQPGDYSDRSRRSSSTRGMTTALTVLELQRTAARPRCRKAIERAYTAYRRGRTAREQRPTSEAGLEMHQLEKWITKTYA